MWGVVQLHLHGLPLSLAYSLNLHKMQGVTVNSRSPFKHAVRHLNSSWRGSLEAKIAGVTYVGLSRVSGSTNHL